MNTVQLNINISYVTNLYAKIKNTGVMAKNCISLARYHDQPTHLKNKKQMNFTSTLNTIYGTVFVKAVMWYSQMQILATFCGKHLAHVLYLTSEFCWVKVINVDKVRPPILITRVCFVFSFP